jgi:two-component system sensor histidine kinase MtrB
MEAQREVFQSPAYPVQANPSLLHQLIAKFRTSMQVRVVSTALGVGILTVTLLGSFLSTSIRDGLFDKRITQIDREYSRTVAQVREILAASQATTNVDVQAQMTTIVQDRVGAGQTSARASALFTTSPTAVGVADTATYAVMESIVTPEMRQATMDSDRAMWQSVSIPALISESRYDEPGVVFGSIVEVPGYGEFGLYMLYSIMPEQESLAFVQRTLMFGAGTILALVGVLTFLVTRQAVTPIQRAAATATKFAEGNLSARMPVRGQDEMAVLACSFNDMAHSLEEQIEQLEKLSVAQRRFVSDVSHELRTPLTTIRMASDMIFDAKDELDAVTARSAELLQNQIDRFEVLLADLLEISRFDAGAAVLDLDQVDLVALAERVVEDASPLAENKRVKVDVQEIAGPFTAEVDSRRIERILRNLVSNAIDHAEGEPVQVQIAGSDDSIAVVVRDHGVGLTESQVFLVFDRFWRGDPSRARTTGGTGLGLAISKEDARLHNGDLEAWGSPGQGASFRLTVPRKSGGRVLESPLPLAGVVGEPEPVIEHVQPAQTQPLADANKETWVHPDLYEEPSVYGMIPTQATESGTEIVSAKGGEQ